MRRRTCRAIAGVALAAAILPGAALLGGSPAQAAATPSGAGWWDKFGIPVPLVPKGGLVVANDPTSALDPSNPIGSQIPVELPDPSVPDLNRADLIGPLAIGALRVTGLSPTSNVTLTLDVAPGSLVLPPSLATILACPLAGPWVTAPAGGDIATAPGYNCDSASTGMVTPGNGSISWLLPSSFQSVPGEIDLALVPNPADPPLPYEVIFDAPTAASLMASTGPAYVGPTPAKTAATPGGTLSTGGVVALSAGGPSAGGGSALSTGGVVALSTGGGSTGGVSGSPELLPAAGLVSERVATDDRGHRVLAVVVLLVIAGLWWYLGAQPTRGPRLLGALAGEKPGPGTGPTEGGVGRFARPRSSGPRRL